MSADLTYNEETGIANVFVNRIPAWHREGHVLTQAPSFDEALTLAGHRYRVAKTPNYIQVPLDVAERTGLPFSKMAGDGGASGTAMIQNPGSFSTVRMDTMVPLGAVGSFYEVVQNEDAFRVLEPVAGRRPRRVGNRRHAPRWRRCVAHGEDYAAGR